jgi:hypothetical protein
MSQPFSPDQTDPLIEVLLREEREHPAAANYTVCLCGSSRFEELFHRWNKTLTLMGLTVFGLSVYPSYMGGRKDWYTEKQKDQLDLMHLVKIAKSDGVLFLNENGYIGESVAREIKYAALRGKDLFFLREPPFCGSCGDKIPYMLAGALTEGSFPPARASMNTRTRH